MCGYVQVNARALGGQVLWSWELQAFVSCLTQILGTELKSCAGAEALLTPEPSLQFQHYFIYSFVGWFVFETRSCCASLAGLETHRVDHAESNHLPSARVTGRHSSNTTLLLHVSRTYLTLSHNEFCRICSPCLECSYIIFLTLQMLPIKTNYFSLATIIIHHRELNRGLVSWFSR